MSIIYDALKKVEATAANVSKTKIKKIAFPPLAGSAIGVIGDSFKRFSQWYRKVFYTFLHQDKSTKPKTNIYLLYALMICLVLLIAIIFSDWFFQEAHLKTANIVAKTQSPVDKKEPNSQPLGKAALLHSVDNRIETPKESQPSFVLNGVFFSGAEGYALINNRIVKKGDKIDGATVTQIFLDEVDLNFGGSIIKLSNSASNSTR